MSDPLAPVPDVDDAVFRDVTIAELLSTEVAITCD